MIIRFIAHVTMLAGILVLSGCSILLDPTNCTSDSECSSGVCTSGVCVTSTQSPEGDASTLDQGPASTDARVMVDMLDHNVDVSIPDAMPPIDMMAPIADQMIPTVPPACEITAQETLTGDSEVRLTITVSHPDTPIDELAVLVNGAELSVDDVGVYQGVFLLENGDNEFQLIAEANGQTCTDSISVTSDRTAPRLENTQPAIGSVIKSGNGRVFVAASVIEAHFAQDLQVFVDGQPMMLVSPVTWTEQAYLFELQLERGIHEIEVLVTDLVGNQLSSATGRDCSVESCLHSFTVDVDSEPPTIQFDNLTTETPNRIPGRSVRLIGTVFDDEVPLAMAFMSVTIRPENDVSRNFGLQTNALGRFDQSVDVLSEMSDSATVEICASDVATNEGCIQLSIEKQLPCIHIDSPTDSSIFSSFSINVAGTICDGVDRVEFRRNDESVSFIAVAGSTNFSSNIPLPQNGSHRITAIAYNDVLGESAEAEITVSRDTTPPSISFTRPITSDPSNAFCTRSTLEACVSVSDNDSGVAQLSIGNLTIPSNQIGTTVCREIEVPSGENVELTAQAVNGSGLVEHSTVLLNVDNRAPFVTFSQPESTLPNPWVKTNAGLVTIGGSVDSGVCATEHFTLNELPLNIQEDNSFSVILPFEEGQQTVTYNVVDLAGNERSSALAFRVDDTSPTIAVNGITDGTYVSTTRAEFTVLVTDTASRIAPDSFRVNDEGYPLTSAGSNNFTGSVTVELSEGINTTDMLIEDRVGNQASTSIQIIRDTTPPVITTLTPITNQAIAVPTIVRGEVTDGDFGVGIERIFVNGLEATIDVNAGTWFAAGVQVDPTVRTIEVYGIDLLGNESVPEIISVRMPNYALVDPLETGIPSLIRPPSAIHTADFNADGLIDILELSDDVNAPSRCLIQRPDSSFEVQSGEVCGLPELSGYQCSKVADFDGDGQLDLLYFSSTASEILFGAPNGSFTSDNVDIVVDQSITGCEVIDIDRDGRLDVVALADDAVYVLFADESLDFQLEDPASLFLDTLRTYESLMAVDLNDDGFTDIIGYGGAGMTVLISSFGGAFQELTVADELPHSGANERDVVVMDADSDGAFEVILMGQTTKLFKRNANNGQVSSFEKQPDAPGSFANQVAARRADINSDGRDDYLAFGAFGVRIIANFGTELSQIDEAPLGLSAVSNVVLAEIVDLDGDGDEDWILGTTTGLKIWKNNLVQREPDHSFFTIMINRFTQMEPTFRPADSHGPHIFIEYIDQVTLDGSGQVLSLEPNRAIIPRKNVPTIVSLGQNAGAHVSIRFVDKGPVGRSLRTQDRISEGETRVFHARE
jgi:hypothetical protein